MSGGHHESKPSYLKELRGFYFAPLLRSAVLGFYLLFFLYAILFYSDHMLLALKFIWYTFTVKTSELTLNHLFWGALFLIGLILPFMVSLFAIILPFEIHKKRWQRVHKVAIITLAFLGATDLIILSDESVRLIKTERPIAAFLEQTSQPKSIGS